jgi:soluble lytic murein transglycosylase
MRPIFLALVLALTAGVARAQGVMDAIRADDWAGAAALAAQYPDPVAAKLVTYYRLLAPAVGGAAEIADFIAANPDWPQQALLALRRDEALATTSDDASVAALCARVAPARPAALVRCAEAEDALGQRAAAADAARAAWRGGLDGVTAEAALLQRFGGALTAADHWRRFATLLGRDDAALARLLPLLDATSQLRARAILALRHDDPQAASLLDAAGSAGRAEPLLFLAQSGWLRRLGRVADARALWQSTGAMAEQLAPPDTRATFWAERDRLARALLRAGDATGAYALADDRAPLSGEAALDQAFLAGFIALEILHDPKQAEPHFRALTTLSEAVITAARAHYWLARTAVARGDGARARAEYAEAARFPLTFYGQLAARALGEAPETLNARILALHDPGWTAAEVDDFAHREVARAATLLVAWGAPRRARPFLTRLASLAQDAADRSMDAHLSLAFGIPDEAVMIARLAGRAGVMLPDAGWPIAAPVPEGPLPPALVLGVIRQESSFDIAAESPSGALGLMQLLPGTARLIAAKLGAPAAPGALTSDARYNIQLGTAYLGQLLDHYAGALPLALAAYNGGPSRVAEWLAENGDPRAGGIDIIDWIELIPFAETRNYVERVTENIAIYRARRGEALAYPLAPWLK